MNKPISQACTQSTNKKPPKDQTRAKTLDNKQASAEGAANVRTINVSEHQLALNSYIVDLCNGLLQLLVNQFPADHKPTQQSASFLQHYIHEVLSAVHLKQMVEVASAAQLTIKETRAKRLKTPKPMQQSALARLRKVWKLNDLEIKLLILSGLIHEHEAFSDIFRRFHPEQKPYPTPSLLLHILGNEIGLREQMSQLLHHSALVKKGLVKLHHPAQYDVPLFTTSLSMHAKDFFVLKTGIAHLTNSLAQDTKVCAAGLTTWLQSEQVKQALHIVKQAKNCVIYFQNHDIHTALNRAKVMLSANQLTFQHIEAHKQTTKSELQSAFAQAIMLRHEPIVSLAEPTKEIQDAINEFTLPLIVCAQQGITLTWHLKMLVEIPLQRLNSDQYQQMWAGLLPHLKDYSRELALKYPLEPHLAYQRIQALACSVKQLDANSNTKSNGKSNAKASFAVVSEFLKAYSAGNIPQGVVRIVPVLTWADLVLPDSQISDLKAALHRLKWQFKVIDEWRFLHNKRGAKGVRMLFSGTPGTGKTLSAEVLANDIGADLLIVDLASLVSKWIGETEKNLSAIFDFAEQSQAVLFFDEADAVFGKRTEVNDANDRYANLETAYLLSRLESYEGITILATNLKNNIDPAFTRRLDFCINFEAPNAQERARLWRCHVPSLAPLDADVDFDYLAGLFPMVGGEIKNAAVGAAYQAAELQQNIKQEHFINAIRRELEKSGKAFREVNPL